MTYTLKGTDSQVLTQLSGSSSEGKGLTKNTHHPRMGEPWSPRELREPPTLVFLALSPAEKVGSHVPVPRREALGLRILLNPTCRKLGTRPWGQGHPGIWSMPVHLGCTISLLTTTPPCTHPHKPEMSLD